VYVDLQNQPLVQINFGSEYYCPYCIVHPCLARQNAYLDSFAGWLQLRRQKSTCYIVLCQTMGDNSEKVYYL